MGPRWTLQVGHGACNPHPKGVGVGVSECGCLVMHACMSVRGIHVCGLGMGACAWVYMGACVCVLARGCLRVRVCIVCECVHAWVYKGACVHACMRVYMGPRVRACTSARGHACVHNVCMHVWGYYIFTRVIMAPTSVACMDGRLGSMTRHKQLF